MGKIKAAIAKSFGGSADPEVYDCPHVIDVIHEKFDDEAFRHRLGELFTATRRLCPAWVPPLVQTVVPAEPAMGQVVDGWLHIWHFGHTDDSAIKGRSNMVNVLEVAFSILENTFNSAQQPIDVLFGSPPGSTIVNFSVRFSMGFTRVLAAKTLLLAMFELEQAELQEVTPVLCSLFTVKFTYNPAPTDALQRCRSLAAKFQVSESTRPDPIQIYYTLSEGLKRDGADVATGLRGKITEYNKMSGVTSQNISELEARVILNLPLQTDQFVSELKYHWQNYKNAESAVPMEMFTHISSDVPPEAQGVWKEIMTPSPAKNEMFLKYLIGFFVKNFKDGVRMKKRINLRFQAHRLRVNDPCMAYRQSCLWVHFRPQMQGEMSLEEYISMEKMFSRGAFDRELGDRVRAMNPTLKLQDFRFFYSQLGKDQPVKEESQLNAAQEEAEAQQEQASAFLESSGWNPKIFDIRNLSHPFLDFPQHFPKVYLTTSIFQGSIMDVGLSMLQGILSPFHRQVGERPGDLEEIPVCYGRLLFHPEGVQSRVFAQSRQHLGSKGG